MDGRIWTGVRLFRPWARRRCCASAVGGPLPLRCLLAEVQGFVGASDGSLTAYRVDGGRWASWRGGGRGSPRACSASLAPVLMRPIVDGHERLREVSGVRVTSAGFEKSMWRGRRSRDRAFAPFGGRRYVCGLGGGGGPYNAFSLAGMADFAGQAS